MGLESVFKLSVVMSLVDNLTKPMAHAASGVSGSIGKLDAAAQAFGSVAKAGAVVTETGKEIVSAVLSPAQAAMETRRAIGELASLGVKDLGAVEDAARAFSDRWAGTTKADFISAAYDIKSGVASLSDEGVAQFTELAALTATATKASVGEMTSLFASGYGIYKDFYGDLSDLTFGKMFAAGIARSVQQFKTDGSQMAAAIQTLGASATTANMPLEEQLSILGSLQATMGGSEAGTKYKAFLRSAAKGGEALGLSFTDANNQLLSMPEILDRIRGKFGETMDAAEKMELQQAFGDTEAVALIDLFYNKTEALRDSITDMRHALGEGTASVEAMAQAINGMESGQFEALSQRIQNVKESIGTALLPAVSDLMGKIEQLVGKLAGWIEKNPELVSKLGEAALGLGAFLAVAGPVLSFLGGAGLAVTGAAAGFNTLRAVFAPLAAALAPVIASVWSFTAALLANPITWVVIGIIALVAAFAILWNKCEAFRGFWIGLWEGIKSFPAAAAAWITAKWNAVTAWFKTAWTVVKGFWAVLWAGLRAAPQALASWVSGLAERAAEAFQSAWEGVTGFFSGLWEGIKGIFTGGVNSVVDTVNGIIGKINGVTAGGAAQALGLAVEIPSIPRLASGGVIRHRPGGVLAQIGEGRFDEAVVPLPDGPRLRQEKPAPARTLSDAFGRGRTAEETGEGRTAGDGSSRQVVIQKLYIPVELRQIRDLERLLALLREVEDYANANGGTAESVSGGAWATA